MPQSPASVLILTPMKSARKHLDAYFAGLEKLTYPHSSLSLGVLESDSTDDTYAEVQRRLTTACDRFRSKSVVKRDFGFHVPENVPRYSAVFQAQRRAVLARSRNHLLFHALKDEHWVLWLDVDVIEYPADILERLLAVQQDIVQPHCVRTYGGPTFDRNAVFLRQPQPLDSRSSSALQRRPWRDRNRGTGHHGEGHGARMLGLARPRNSPRRYVTSCDPPFLPARP
jgi:peptide chain release factor subunit 1